MYFSVTQSKRVLASAIVAMVSIAPCVGADEPKASENQVTSDVVYATADGIEMKLDLRVPATGVSTHHNSAKPALVVWIHGGGWRAGSRKKCPLTDLTQHGFAVASISYRFTDKAIFPAQIHDCKAAIRWLRAHQDQYGYDASWIAVAGSSAGGHLALLLGTSGGIGEMEGNLGEHGDQSSTIQAVIDYFGPSDFILRGKTQPERAYTTESGSLALLGGLRDGKVDPRMESMASPASYVSSNDPPLLVFHGTEDQTVLMDQSQRIVALYNEAGLSARLISVEGAGHGGKAFFTKDHFQRALDFLVQYPPAIASND
ncbi:alpha/beta hydrolase [Rubripirellula reticaptiva]|uniref:Lipase 2 n=1 Tax=Rubripirellula reticaptiva TaxID=2528013 RepID=A0A5C6F3S3_9BACT|nr:alpha/beta hydrolase [Rubripirellula reticaptiva]TWU55097.1 Lipase 2 [Rubripirellula reticaptiva]